MVEEEWFKLIIEEVRINNAKIDDLRKDMDEKTDDLSKGIAKVFTRAAELDVHVNQTREDVVKVEHMLQGNGAPGLKTQIQLLEKDLAILKEESDKRDQVEIEDKKSSTAVKIALIGASSAGVAAFVKIIVDLLA